MRVGKCHTPTGRIAKPIFDETGFTCRSSSVKDEKRIDVTISNGEWRVRISREEFEMMKEWFERERPKANVYICA